MFKLESCRCFRSFLIMLPITTCAGPKGEWQMLDFSFTEEQEMIRRMVRDFGQKELAPGYAARVKAGSVPPEMIKKIADLGLMGLNIPEQYEGQMKDAVTTGVILEELARHADDAA